MTDPQLTTLAVNALFPVYLFCKDYPDPEGLNPVLERYAYDLRDGDPDGRPVSTRKGWQSQGDLDRHQACRPLIRFIESTMLEIKQFMNGADSVNFFVRSCWANINPRGSHNAAHIHGNTFFSGVYYVKTPVNSGLIEFRDPTNVREVFHFDFKATTPENCFSQSYQPRPGRMFIFPGYLPHEVGENLSDEDRVSYAFNIWSR
ncbi:MAG: TIGR02466 family protein [Gammaproteobacteria bacterium]|nr:TIGR02466 family protein [Gammaproteobacteria bacterium]